MIHGAAVPPPLVQVKSRDRVAIICMASPLNHNALSVALREALLDALQAANASDNYDGIVLAGSDRAFCVGGDLRSMAGMTREQGMARIIAAQALPRAIHTSKKPVVAAVEGICAGAGLAIAAVCDFVVAGKGAQFITSFEKVGLMPDLGATYSIRARIGAQAARRLLVLGGKLDADEAQKSGLSDFLVDQGHAEAAAAELVGRLTRTAPGALNAVRKAFRDPPATLEDAFRHEIEHQPALYTSADLQEGIAAFLEKRDPVWRDD